MGVCSQYISLYLFAFILDLIDGGEKVANHADQWRFAMTFQTQSSSSPGQMKVYRKGDKTNDTRNFQFYLRKTLAVSECEYALALKYKGYLRYNTFLK